MKYLILLFAVLCLSSLAQAEDENKMLESANTELIEIYSSLYQMDAMTENCLDFQNSSHHLAYRVDGDLEMNFKNIRKRFLQEAKKSEECSNILDEQRAVIQSKAKEKFEKSDMGELIALQKKMGAHIYINESDVYDRIRGCNTLSQRFKLLYKANKDKELTCESVK